MAQSNFRNLKKALSRVLKNVAVAGPGTVLEPVWESSVGHLLAHRSRPVHLRQNVLTVEVDPDFLAELENLQGEICRRLNQQLGENAIRRIDCLSRNR